MPNKITAYECIYCKKKYKSLVYCIMHESKCYKNPENFVQCFYGCRYLSKHEITLYFDNPLGGELTRDVNCFFCEKKQTFLYPPIVKSKGNMFDFGDYENIEMPKSCNKFNCIY